MDDVRKVFAGDDALEKLNSVSCLNSIFEIEAIGVLYKKFEEFILKDPYVLSRVMYVDFSKAFRNAFWCLPHTVEKIPKNVYEEAIKLLQENKLYTKGLVAKSQRSSFQIPEYVILPILRRHDLSTSSREVLFEILFQYLKEMRELYLKGFSSYFAYLTYFRNYLLLPDSKFEIPDNILNRPDSLDLIEILVRLFCQGDGFITGGFFIPSDFEKCKSYVKDSKTGDDSSLSSLLLYFTFPINPYGVVPERKRLQKLSRTLLNDFIFCCNIRLFFSKAFTYEELSRHTLENAVQELNITQELEKIPQVLYDFSRFLYKSLIHPETFDDQEYKMFHKDVMAPNIFSMLRLMKRLYLSWFPSRRAYYYKKALDWALIGNKATSRGQKEMSFQEEIQRYTLIFFTSRSLGLTKWVSDVLFPLLIKEICDNVSHIELIRAILNVKKPKVIPLEVRVNFVRFIDALSREVVQKIMTNSPTSIELTRLLLNPYILEFITYDKYVRHFIYAPSIIGFGFRMLNKKIDIPDEVCNRLTPQQAYDLVKNIYFLGINNNVKINRRILWDKCLVLLVTKPELETSIRLFCQNGFLEGGTPQC